MFAIADAPVSRDPLPVCPLTGNPYRLVSLLDMIRFYADRFLEITQALSALETLAQSPQWQSATFGDAKTNELFRKELRDLIGYLKELDLPMTLKSAERLLAEIGPGRSMKDAHISLFDVQSRLSDELAGVLLFAVRSDKAKHYDDPQPFGHSVSDAFPSAVWDITEAGRCLALARPTASVFHLMRVLETGLVTLARTLGVPADRTNWEILINQIEKAIAGIDRQNANERPVNWKDDREFYSQCASHLRIVKDAWRNYTAHARGKYTDEEATDIFTGVRAFMQKLATRVHE